MNRSQRFVVAGSVMVVAAGALGMAFIIKKGPRVDPPPPARAPIARKLPPEPPPHPILPPDPNPVAHPPAAFCEERDIHAVALLIRGAHKRARQVAARAPAAGAPPTCHADPVDRELLGALNGLIGRTGMCVARDSTLDSQWSQLESSVSELDRCMDCIRPRDDRLTGCRRVLEMADAAQKATP